jgi:Holliday junction resolvase RusA-like endonuclease
MSDIIIRLAGPPRGKQAMTGHGKRRFLPTPTRDYMAALRLASQHVMGSREPLAGALEVLVHASFQIPASWSKKKQLEAKLGEVWPTVKPDYDNILKILDALNGVVYVDDKQIVKAECEKVYSTTPELVVRVRPRGSTDGLR